MMRAFTAPFKDIGKAFSYGFDLPRNVQEEGIRGLTTGFHPHVGGAVIGGMAGGMLGMKVDEESAVPFMLGGAAIGSAALPALGLAGAAAYGVGAGIVKNSDKILQGTVTSGKWIGQSLWRGISGPGFDESTRMGYWGNKILNPVARHATAVGNIAKHFAEYEPKRQVYDPKRERLVTKGGFKLKPLGWGVIGLGAAIGGARSAMDTSDRIRMGQVDPYITRPTPQLPSYANNAGATGDLVFALNANRRG